MSALGQHVPTLALHCHVYKSTITEQITLVRESAFRGEQNERACILHPVSALTG